MTSRRSFFKRVAAAVAIVALAPEMCFGRLKSPKWERLNFVIPEVPQPPLIDPRLCDCGPVVVPLKTLQAETYVVEALNQIIVWENFSIE